MTLAVASIKSVRILFARILNGRHGLGGHQVNWRPYRDPYANQLDGSRRQSIRQGWRGMIARLNRSRADRSVFEITGSAIVPDTSRFFPRSGTAMQASGTRLAVITSSVSTSDALPGPQ
jgi:hypothetical protein